MNAVWFVGGLVLLVLVCRRCTSSRSVITLGDGYKVETLNCKTTVSKGWTVLAHLNEHETYTLPDGTVIKALSGGQEVRKRSGAVIRQQQS